MTNAAASVASVGLQICEYIAEQSIGLATILQEYSSNASWLRFLLRIIKPFTSIAINHVDYVRLIQI